MNVSTRRELQTLSDNIRVTQGTAEGSSLAYRVAWIGLVAPPLIAVAVVPQLRGPYAGASLVVLLPFFVQSLYTIIQYKVNQHLRPILDALLYVQEELPKQTTPAPATPIKAKKSQRRRSKKN